MLREKKQKPAKGKKPEAIKTCLEVIPIRSYDERLAAFVLEDGSYMDILRIIPRDLDNTADDEIQLEIYNLMKIYKTVGCDLKFVSMKFPLTLTNQKQVLQHHRERAQDAVRRRWLDRQIRELELAESNVSTQNFYLFFFGEAEAGFIKNKEDLLKFAGSGTNRLVEEINQYEKGQILQKLNNMNTEIDLHYYERRGAEE
ncbi:MAG: hypothetical protein VB023_04445 [Oscillibacter sp.]|nr:hypothetical protein [Oscillibacter sp.]